MAEGTFEDMFIDDDIDGDIMDVTDERTDERNSTASERVKRQSGFPGAENDKTDKSKSDVCESKVEVETPFWAVNSEGKLRAILNNKEFEQAVHQVQWHDAS